MKKNITKATSYQVTELAGVSQSAVSRAYKSGANVSTKTRKNIYAAARKLLILAVSHWRISNGLIKEEWTVFDELAVLRQAYADK